MWRYVILVAALGCAGFAIVVGSGREKSASAEPSQRTAVKKKLPDMLSPLSVRVTRRIRLWERPGEDSLGEVTANTYLPYVGLVEGTRNMCPSGKWYKVGNSRYLCSDHGMPSYRFPHGRTLPVLPEGELIPYRVYFSRRDGVPVYNNAKDAEAGNLDRVVEKGFSFAARRTRRVGKETFLLTWTFDLVPRKEMYQHRPSDFEGIQLSGIPEKPWACVIARPGAWTYEKPGKGARKTSERLRYHTWVQILEEEKRGSRLYYRVDSDKWVHARDVRRVRFSDPPKELEHPDEPWVEVLTGQQTLVMYEGARPIFATIISTGKSSEPTPPGVFRVWIKISVEEMNNRPGAAHQYKVEAVPWILYYHEGYAIHGAYWHDGFGRARSNGCINLSPKDARFVFDRSLPKMPDGWHSRWAVDDAPGMIVRVRDNVNQEVSMFPLTQRKR